MCLIDISDFIDMAFFISAEECFNIPFISFNSGTFLGDNDTLDNKQALRTHTAICETNSNIYYIKRNRLEFIMEAFPKIKKQMWTIAK